MARMELPPCAAFVHQLSKEELQYYNDITHFGAVFNINIIKKEDTLMVEKLMVYRKELEDKKAGLIAADYSTEINEKVLAYRDALIKATEDTRANEIAKVDSDIACINTIIEREQINEANVAEPTVAE